ncbi:MAG TPA: MG2 domain-containing protein, partial [Kofleriaceae bacterium]|nr:MG2 domain-containing protein [Kofleriaceae bacterium]
IAAKRTLDFFSTNYAQLKVELYKVTPADYDAYGNYVQNQWNKDKPRAPVGAKVFDRLVKTTKGKNDLVETNVDLASALDKTGLGHAIAIVEPSPWTQPYEPPRLITWVQSTKLAVDAHVDADSLVAFVTELETGKPAANVEVELRPAGTKATTDAQGLATLELPTGPTKGSHHLIARRGNDVAFVSEHGGYWSEYGSWTKQARGKNVAWYVIDDRKLYKPGEEVTLVGWLRTIDQGKNGDVGPMPGLSAVDYRVFDSQNAEIAKGSTTISTVGGFHTKFTLPKTPNLGYARVELVAKGKDPWVTSGGTFHHGFQIEEFRRPEFEVSAAASQGPFLVGEGGDVTVKAKYYTGAPLPAAPVQWNVTATPTSFTPPNRDDYIFGAWEPWWGHRGHDDDYSYRGGGGRRHQPAKSWDLASKTDAIGEHVMHLDFLSIKPALPMSVQTTASVTDVNRQTWTAQSALIVHPASYYVGLKAKKPFVDKGKPFELAVIGVDLDGKPVAGAKIDVKAVRLDYEYKKGEYVEKEVDAQTCAVTAAADPGACQFATKEGGAYKVTATITDDRGRPNTTTMSFWVSGGKRVASREVAQEQVTLIPDKKEYRPGDTAELLVQAPFFPAEGIVTWRRSGIVKTERITLDGPSAVVKVPITDAMTPNLFVQVDLVGAAERLDDHGDPDPKLPKRPAYAVGQIGLAVPPKHRSLGVSVKPALAKVGPGETTKVDVVVTDAAGKPVPGADAAVLVVDEAVLALSGYTYPDPLGLFYAARGADTRDHYLRAEVKLAQPSANVLGQEAASDGVGYGGATSGRMYPSEATLDSAAAPLAAPAAERANKPRAQMKKRNGLAGEVDEEHSNASAGTPIAIRSNFNPLAAFAPAVKTDGQGRATVEIKVPDNLTR